MKHLLKTKIFLFLTAFLFVAVNSFAQLQPDNVRTVPTTDESTSLIGMYTHLTDSSKATVGQVPDISDEEIGSTKNGSYVEYQIMSADGGTFLVEVLAGSKANGASVNIGVYKTLTEFWPEEGGLGDTVSIANTGNWGHKNPYNVPITLEPGIVYSMRINFISSISNNNWICNLWGISVNAFEGSLDNSLSDIKVNGESVPNFDPEVFSYSIPLAPNVGLSSLEATPNDEKATVEIPEDLTIVNGKGSFDIVVTSEAGIAATYTVDVLEPILIDDNIVLAMSSIFASTGPTATDIKLNSLQNGSYVDYYVYAAYDDNFKLHMPCTNGYGESMSYMNVSTLAIDAQDEWMPRDIYTQRIMPTFDLDGGSTWDPIYSDDYEYIITLKEFEPTLLRLYFETTNGTAGDIHSMTFATEYDPIDATLSDLQVDNVSIKDFDPEITMYSVALPAGTISITTKGVANDAEAVVTGDGEIDLTGVLNASDTITVTSGSGFAIDYIVNFSMPIEIPNTSENDTLKLAMVSNLFRSEDVGTVNDGQLNYWANEGYIEYLVYSEVDKDVFVRANVANGANADLGVDTTWAALNVNIFGLDQEWEYINDNSYYVPHMPTWGAESAENMDWNISLKAGEAVILRLYGITNNYVADAYGISIIQGQSDYVGEIPTSIEKPIIKENSINVFGTSGSINLQCNDDFVGGTVQIFDISGNLIVNKLVTGTNNVYGVNQKGLYIVRVINENNLVETAKCIVQ